MKRARKKEDPDREGLKGPGIRARDKRDPDIERGSRAQRGKGGEH